MFRKLLERGLREEEAECALLFSYHRPLHPTTNLFFCQNHTSLYCYYLYTGNFLLPSSYPLLFRSVPFSCLEPHQPLEPCLAFSQRQFQGIPPKYHTSFLFLSPVTPIHSYAKLSLLFPFPGAAMTVPFTLGYRASRSKVSSFLFKNPAKEPSLKAGLMVPSWGGKGESPHISHSSHFCCWSYSISR